MHLQLRIQISDFTHCILHRNSLKKTLWSHAICSRSATYPSNSASLSCSNKPTKYSKNSMREIKEHRPSPSSCTCSKALLMSTTTVTPWYICSQCTVPFPTWLPTLFFMLLLHCCLLLRPITLLLFFHSGIAGTLSHWHHRVRVGNNTMRPLTRDILWEKRKRSVLCKNTTISPQVSVLRFNGTMGWNQSSPTPLFAL